MRLLEHEGKGLLAKYGVPIPQGALWPEVARIPHPAVVKSQILEGGRGHRGGVLLSTSVDETRGHAESLLRGTDRLPAAHAVLVEQRLDIARELYLAIVIDRSLQSPALVASARGGVDVEAAGPEAFLRVKIHALSGMPPFAARQVSMHMGIGDRDQRDQLANIVAALGRAFFDEDCELLEINPLVVTADGRLVAADARVTVDDAARFRHAEWPLRAEGTPFENTCAAAGASGVEMDGDIAIVTSGAGLSMATLDSLTAAGGRARCVVDLGGTVFHGLDAMTEVFAAALGLRPRVLLVNAFFQLARCDLLARGIVAGVRRAGGATRIVARLHGLAAQEAATILSPLDVLVTEQMKIAVAEAARHA